MAKQPSPFLKIFRDVPAGGEIDGSGAALAEPNAARAEMDAICEAINRATGSTLRYAPGSVPASDPNLEWSTPLPLGGGAAPGHLRMDRVGGPRGGGTRRVAAAEARQLAERLARLIAERAELQRALRHREAELAAGVPVKQHPRAAGHLAERLEAVLRGCAEGLDCQAAAMYLLDDATTELKLRAHWGLPASRLLDAPRPLRGAIADLEALSGHAVALEDDKLFELWNAPERLGAALCTPISGPATVLGTLWLYSVAPRNFSARETNLVEIVAGRLAAELDREMLWSALAAPGLGSPPAAGAIPFAPVPSVAPLSAGWEIAGRVASDDASEPTPTGRFVDWISGADDGVRTIVGDAGSGVDGAVVAAGLRGVWRSGAEQGADPAALVDSLGQFLWSTSSGDREVSLLAIELLPRGEVRLASAGHVTGMVKHHGPTDAPLSPIADLDAPPIGRDPEPRRGSSRVALSAGDTLVLIAGATGQPLAGVDGKCMEAATAAELCARLTAAPHAARAVLVAKWRGLTGAAARP